MGFANVVRSICSPPISFAMEAMSGVVATTFSFANAVVVRSRRMDKKVSIDFIKLEFVSAMGAKEEFDLKPDRMFVAKMFAMVVVVLQTDLGEFAGVKRQVRRDARALSPEDVSESKAPLFPSTHSPRRPATTSA